MGPTRRAALAVGVAALVVAAVVVTVVIATAHQNVGLNERELVLNGRPPTSASLSFTIDVSSVENITAHADIDFATSSISGTVDIPELVSTDVASFILVPGTLYVSVPNLISATRTPWVAIPTTATDHGLGGLARDLERARSLLVQPDAALGRASTSRAGTFTTYSFSNPTATVIDPASVPLRIPSTVSVDATLTVGVVGQFAEGNVMISAPHLDDTVQMIVDSYDHPVTIAAPPARLVSPVTAAVRRRVLGTAGGWLNRLLTSRGIASLFTIRVT